MNKNGYYCCHYFFSFIVGKKRKVRMDNALSISFQRNTQYKIGKHQCYASTYIYIYDTLEIRTLPVSVTDKDDMSPYEDIPHLSITKNGNVLISRVSYMRIFSGQSKDVVPKFSIAYEHVCRFVPFAVAPIKIQSTQFDSIFITSQFRAPFSLFNRSPSRLIDHCHSQCDAR